MSRNSVIAAIACFLISVILIGGTWIWRTRVIDQQLQAAIASSTAYVEQGYLALAHFQLKHYASRLGHSPHDTAVRSQIASLEYRIAVGQYEKGAYQESLASLEVATKLAPFSYHYGWKALNYIELSSPDSAANALKQAEAILADSPTGIGYFIGNIFASLGDIKGAIRVYEYALKNDTTNVGKRLRLARFHLQISAWISARAIAIQVHNDVRYGSDPARAALSILSSTVLAETEEIRHSTPKTARSDEIEIDAVRLAALQRLIDQEDLIESDISALAFSLSSIGITHVEARRFTAAQAALEIAQELRPTSRSGMWLSLVYHELGRTSEARATIKLAEELLGHDSVATAYMVGEAYETLGDFMSAIRVYAQVLDQDPSDLTARLKLARLYMKSDNQLAAISQLREVISHNEYAPEAKEAKAILATFAPDETTKNSSQNQSM